MVHCTRRRPRALNKKGTRARHVPFIIVATKVLPAIALATTAAAAAATATTATATAAAAGSTTAATATATATAATAAEATTTKATAAEAAATAVLCQKTARAQTERGCHRARCHYSIQFHVYPLGWFVFVISYIVRQHHTRAI
jgi:cobalamin biosynthesis Mg chelatase CobN